MLPSVEFIKTPPQGPIAPPSDKYGVKTTNSPTIHNAPLPADGPGAKHFSNLVLAGLLIGVPWFIVRKIGLGFKTWLVLFLLFGLPILMAYWTVMSTYSPRLNEKVKFPNKPVGDYLEFHTEQLENKYVKSNNGKGTKIPMETFHELYFDGKVSFKGDCLDVLEFRHDWCSFSFTLSLFRFFLLGMIPEVIMHSKSQDEEQVRDHYDRGDDFYTWFLGPRMIYTSGVISDITKEETLEQLQDNKLKTVAEKIQLAKGEQVLDLGCGWGTWATYASSQYGAHVTGITLGRNQTKWGTSLLSQYGVDSSQSEIVCCDYRDAPKSKKSNGKYDKITCLEMAEHVGVRRFGAFLKQVYDSLEDDGLFFLQYAGLRKSWQYEDLVWGLFMNKYIFPGADASTPLSFVITSLESTGFEVVSFDNIGVHYSATLWRWYRNWIGNKAKVLDKYGIRWFRIWEYFLASSVITSRQGGASCYQIVMRKNLNSYHRVNYIPKQDGVLGPVSRGTKWAQ
ncbi:Sphingolipid C9-methyltransferase [Yamadazyma tenuis]|uniref:sphingolipid C(9)-methyltransferase n=1 Tax=Candida tenuis (strain ATCC 10573 / BCRC 21748 / CBS 615 / JCM 9827 / NBRC 10315 / NRRL Y-1498 / VKM Y-70) TaxID=590646 RepID=G3B991_CANTC|nr:S-adenosyl-L-methionine-dependent methyltransferase [Yamadazyma tenuis ATCC 10573]EGV61838.1 S-adenosyl-L-methionine-dependent methyltransferase [Yamadazyma tenuis ATCC 10573]WEJ93068.1 Sphingolipid C9-methyltransferase [Yamadazyma tenuis]